MAKSTASEDASLNAACQVFRLLSDKTRLQIVMMLASGDRNVMALCEALGLPQPTVSHHLGLLRMNHLIVNKRMGKRVMYALDPNAAKVGGGKLKFNCPPYNITVDGH